jgi:hypothetical protein
MEITYIKYSRGDYSEVAKNIDNKTFWYKKGATKPYIQVDYKIEDYLVHPDIYKKISEEEFLEFIKKEPRTPIDTTGW